MISPRQTVLKPWNLAFMCVAIIATFACKKEQQRSEIKTLDSIAGGPAGIDNYQCSGNQSGMVQDSHIKVDQKSALDKNTEVQARSAVKNYFSALPVEVQRLYLDDLRGEILITKKPEAYCSGINALKNLDVSQSEKVMGCFVFVNDPTKKKNSILTLVHTPNAKEIQYYGPMIIGYLYAQFYSRWSPSSSGSTVFDLAAKESDTFIDMKIAVTDAFLEDIHFTAQSTTPKGGSYSLAPLAELVGADYASAMKSTNDRPLVNRLSFSRFSDKDSSTPADKASRKKQFSDYVFAHAFQSLYCSDQSRKAIATSFPKTQENFANLNRDIIAVSAKLSGSAKSTATSTGASSESAKRTFALDSSQTNLAGDAGLNAMIPLLSGNNSLSSGTSTLGALLQSFFKSGQTPSVPSAPGTPSIGQDATPSVDGGINQSLFSQLQNAGCDGCNCPGGSCGGEGSCSGGCCSNCANGNCGGCTGGCSCNS